MWFCFLLPILAIIPAMIAKNKGHDAAVFYFYGLLLFIVALPHALMLTPKQSELAKRPGMKSCPACLSAIPAAATRCAHCQSDQPAQE